MCGRFGNITREEWIHNRFAEYDVNLVIMSDLSKRKKTNIAPTDAIVAITNENNNITADLNYWGIKFSEKSPLIFNSRIETISAKSFWRRLFDKNRCIIPLTEFYEWKKVDEKKIPFKINLTNEKVFFVPGLFHLAKDNNKYVSLITTEPNDFMKDIHHRMPVILTISEAIKYLLDDSEDNIEKCLPYKDSDKMEMEEAQL